MSILYDWFLSNIPLIKSKHKGTRQIEIVLRMHLKLLHWNQLLISNLLCWLSQTNLPHEGAVVFVVSTTGQGDTPDSMKVSWRKYHHNSVTMWNFVSACTSPISFLNYYLMCMQGFWKYLLQRNLTEEWLKEVHYAVFGLGDSGYQKFNVILCCSFDYLSLFYYFFS